MPTIEGLGLAADPVQKRLIPTVMQALSETGRIGRVGTAIDAALISGMLVEPFSKEDFRRVCPGFGNGTVSSVPVEASQRERAYNGAI